MSTTAEKTYAQLKKGKTRYVLEGELDNKNAPLIVCVHGIGSGVYSFQTFANEVLKHGGFRILRLDLYGRGFSDSVHEPHTGELFVEQLHELLVHLNLFDKIILVGHSMGGVIAVLFTYQYPDVVEKLILLTPAGLPWNLPLGSSFLKIPWLGKWGFSLLTSWMTIEKAIAENFFDVKYAKDNMDFLIKNRLESGTEKFIDAMVNSVK